MELDSYSKLDVTNQECIAAVQRQDGNDCSFRSLFRGFNPVPQIQSKKAKCLLHEYPTCA
jgi:hypothetical protein